MRKKIGKVFNRYAKENLHLWLDATRIVIRARLVFAFSLTHCWITLREGGSRSFYCFCFNIIYSSRFRVCYFFLALVPFYLSWCWLGQADAKNAWCTSAQIWWSQWKKTLLFSFYRPNYVSCIGNSTQLDPFTSSIQHFHHLCRITSSFHLTLITLLYN